jgi:hypothetical protein
MRRDEIGIGDPVEYRQLMRSPPCEVWIAGTVCSLDQNQIGIANAAAQRIAFPRRSRQWRPA